MSIVVYDDASNLPTSQYTLETSCDGTVLNFPNPIDDDDWLHVYDMLRELGLNKTSLPRVTCFRGVNHLGSGGSKYWLFGIVRSLAEPNDVVLILDGDDTLRGTNALEIVNQKYLDSHAWFTYGSYEGKWSHQIKDLAPELRNGKKKFEPRIEPWLYGHPRTFKGHLLNYITANDFQYSDGSWLIKGTDRGFVYRMLELAGPDRIGYIPEKIYNYVYSNVTSTVSKELRAGQIRHTKEMKPSKLLYPDVHVVMLIWKRSYLLSKQLIWLQLQVGMKRRAIHVHLVNNNWMERKAVDDIVDTFRAWQIDNTGFHYLMNENVSVPIKVSVKHMEGKLHHNFARFVYVNELRKETALDEVIFLDDDQYWAPTFVSTLLEAHQTKSMTSWYGKTYEPDEKGVGQYWKPMLGFTDLIQGKGWPRLATFKY